MVKTLNSPIDTMTDRDLVLASSSPFRKALLEQLKLPFEVDAPNIDETPCPDEAPCAYVERLALSKAKTVAERHPNALVIGSDQTAAHDGALVGKPVDHQAAVRQLQAAAGRRITLYTGLAVIDSESGRTQCDVIPYQVYFRDFDAATIERYLSREQPYGCTGSLRAEGLGIALLSKFEGDDPNALIGLPLIRLVDMLANERLQIV